MRTVSGTYYHFGRPLETLWDWYRIRIERDAETDTVFVIFCSDIHVDRECQLPVSFRASQFTDREILMDRTLITQVIGRYGVDISRKL